MVKHFPLIIIWFGNYKNRRFHSKQLVHSFIDSFNEIALERNTNDDHINSLILLFIYLNKKIEKIQENFYKFPNHISENSFTSSPTRGIYPLVIGDLLLLSGIEMDLLEMKFASILLHFLVHTRYKYKLTASATPSTKPREWKREDGNLVIKYYMAFRFIRSLTYSDCYKTLGLYSFLTFHMWMSSIGCCCSWSVEILIKECEFNGYRELQ